MQLCNVGRAMQEAVDQSFHAANMYARDKAQDELTQTIGPMLQNMERLTLVCEAMWSLMQERTNLTEEDLSQRVTDLDMADGVKDNKHTRGPLDCPDCGSKVCRKFSRCLFCGFKSPEESAFDTV